jgi:lysophospholipase L1-like esterase
MPDGPAHKEFIKIPEIFGPKPIVVLCGDSITQGEYSYNWFQHVRDIFKGKVDVYNEGYNSYTVSEYINTKIQGVINLNPTDIIISLGTNDANAQWRHPNDPQWSVENFEKNYHELIGIIKEKLPNAKIAITTIPPIGEDFNHPVYVLGKLYNEVIKDIAKKENVELLPVFDMLQNEYKENTQKIKPKFKHTMFGEVISMTNNIIRTKLGQDSKEISKSGGYKGKVDELHLNKSAKVFAACASWFIKKNHESLQTS